jgi:hypothetical protein
MKAEHRKELQTNVLADHMGRFLQSIRSGQPSTSIIGWVIAALVVAVVAGWYYFSHLAPPPWNELYGANDLPGQHLEEPTKSDRYRKLEDIAKKNRGTPLAKAARFEQARDLLRSGQDIVCAKPTEARDLLGKASELYEQLALESTAQPLLAQEALLGVARAEESRGNLPRAREYYEKLATAYPKSAAGESAKKNATELAEELNAGHGPRTDFYKKLDAQIAEAAKRQAASAPPPAPLP